MDVAAWLQSLGLSRYEAAFSKNAIDVDVLADLTDGDLAELGVNLGDRKRLLKAIARLGCAEPPKRAAETQSSSKDDAERRPITVLFCDLSVRPQSRPSSTPRTGATSSGHTSTQRRRL